MSLNWSNVKSLAIPVGGVSRDVKRVSIGGVTVWKKSTTPTAKDYPQNGIAVRYDGIENAGWGISNTSTTLWTELVSGRQSVVSGNSWTGKSLALTGANGVDLFTGGVLYNTDLTIFGRIKNPTFLRTGYYTTLLGLGTASGHEKGLCIQFGHNVPSARVEVRTGYSGTVLAYVNLGLTSVSLTKSYCIVWHRNSLSFDVYMDGVFIGSATIPTGNYALDDQTNEFGMAGYRTIIDQGVEMFNAGLYTRALSENEVATLYAIDVARFEVGGAS